MDDVEISDRSGSVQVRHGKGHKTRSVPLNKDARGALEEWLTARREVDPDGEHEHLFLSQKGGPLNARAIGFRVSALAKKADLENVSPHALRYPSPRTCLLWVVSDRDAHPNLPAKPADAVGIGTRPPYPGGMVTSNV